MHTPRALRNPLLLVALVAVVAPAALAALPIGVAAQTIAPGTALISVSGAVETTLVLPLVPGTAVPTDSGFELRFQDADRNTLNVTLTVDSGRVTDTFVGVGVPGTSIFDAAYFADFLHTQCTTQVVMLDATGVSAAVDCAGLENGAGDATIDLHAELTTVGLPTPSASPGLGSPTPSGPVASPQVAG